MISDLHDLEVRRPPRQTRERRRVLPQLCAKGRGLSLAVDHLGHALVSANAEAKQTRSHSPAHPQALPARGSAADQVHGAGRDPAAFSDEPYCRTGGAPLLRRLGYPDIEPSSSRRIVDDASQLGLG
jgi:hypothetical protein